MPADLSTEGSIPKLALAAYALFVAVAFGWRTWLQYRRTGDSGFRGFAGDAAARAASMLLAVGLLLALLAPILELVDWATPLPLSALSAGSAIHAMGITAFVLGFALTVIAQLQMGASWRIGVSPTERTALVTDGVFRYVRNPIFTGMLLAIAGLVLLVPNLVAAVAGLCTLAGLELQVRSVEEPYLMRTHRDAYREYARSAGRFVPGLGRLR